MNVSFTENIKIKNFSQTNSIWAHIDKRTYFFVGSCSDYSFTGGVLIHITQKVNGAYPNNSLALIICKKGYDCVSASAASYCRNGTWLPTPQCIGSNNILLQNWETHKN